MDEGHVAALARLVGVVGRGERAQAGPEDREVADHVGRVGPVERPVLVEDVVEGEAADGRAGAGQDGHDGDGQHGGPDGPADPGLAEAQPAVGDDGQAEEEKDREGQDDDAGPGVRQQDGQGHDGRRGEEQDGAQDPLGGPQADLLPEALDPEGHHVHAGHGQAQRQRDDHLQVAREMVAVDEGAGGRVGAEDLLIKKEAGLGAGQLEEPVEGLEDARRDQGDDDGPDAAAAAGGPQDEPTQ